MREAVLKACLGPGLTLSLGLGLWTQARAACGTVVMPTGVGQSEIPSPVASLHPVLITGSEYEFELLNLILRPLVWTTPTPSIDWANSMASAIVASAGDTVFTVTLKDFAWSDGQAVTAADVLYDWSLIRQYGRAYSQYGIGGVPEAIRSVTAPDAHHLRFVTTHAYNPEEFEIAGLSQFYALPRQAWARYDIPTQQSMQSQASFYAVGDGPFRLQSLELGRHAVFVPNDRYSGHHASIGRFVVDFLQGTDPLQALQAGQIDLASMPFLLWNALGTTKDIRRVSQGAVPVNDAITPNLRNPSDAFFRDVRVRQAIARAINQQRLIDTIFHGQSRIETNTVPAATPALLAPDLRDGHSAMGYDPDAARRLLDEAGWKPGPDGVRLKGGKRLAFAVLTPSGGELQLLFMQEVQSDLAAVGVSISIQQVEFNQLLARMVGPAAGWDSTFLAYSSQSFPDPSQTYQTGAYGNFGGYSDPTMDRLLAAAARDPTLDGLFAVENYAVEQQPVFYLPDGYASILARRGIEGVGQAFQPNGLWAPEYLTLSGPMACNAPHV